MAESGIRVHFFYRNGSAGPSVPYTREPPKDEDVTELVGRIARRAGITLWDRAVVRWPDGSEQTVTSRDPDL